MVLSGYEALFFWIFALAAIFAALLTVMAKNAVHSALFLISSLVSVAALFVLSGAEFIAKAEAIAERSRDRRQTDSTEIIRRSRDSNWNE